MVVQRADLWGALTAYSMAVRRAVWRAGLMVGLMVDLMVDLKDAQWAD